MVCVKKSLLIVLVLCICLSGCGTRAEESKEEALPIVYIGGSDRPYVFDYNSLEDGAQLIVKVTALEKTDQQVRTTYLDRVDRYEPVSGGSYRKLLIDQVIKGEKERDYGEHRYNHRTYYTISETAEVQGINEQGYIHSIVTKVTWGECVCGLQGRWTEKRDVM